MPQIYKKDKKLGSVVNSIRSHKYFVRTCPEVGRRHFIWNIKEVRSDLIKEILLSFENPNKVQIDVHEIEPESPWAKLWNMVRQKSEKEKEINIGSIINDIRSHGNYINNDPIFRAQLLEKGFVMNVDEERGNLFKEQMRKYDNPNKKRIYVEKDLDPALAKRWNMVRHESEKENEIKIGQIIHNIRTHGIYIDNDPVFFEYLIAKGFKMHDQDAKKNQERIEQKRELHRQKKEQALMGREDKLIGRVSRQYCSP